MQNLICEKAVINGTKMDKIGLANSGVALKRSTTYLPQKLKYMFNLNVPGKGLQLQVSISFLAINKSILQRHNTIFSVSL